MKTPWIVLLPALCSLATACSTGDSTQPIAHNGGTLQGDQTWAKGTHNVNGSITMVNGTLTIAAGSTVIMAAGSGQSFGFIIGKGGGLQINGTADAPVTITSGATAPNRGDWGTIDFQEGSLGTSAISYTKISYGGASAGGTTAVGAITVEGGAQVAISNTDVDNSASYGIAVPGDATLGNFAGNNLVHNTLGAMAVTSNVAGMLGAGTYAPNDANGIFVLTSQLSQNANWINPGTPWVLTSGLAVETLAGTTGTAILNIAAGSTLLMAPYTNIEVQKNGALVLAGTQDAPVVITSQSVPANRGDWKEIDFFINSLASVNSISWAEIEYGGGNQQGAIWLESGAQVTMQNTTVANSEDVGIEVSPGGQLPNFANNTLINNTLGPIKIDVDDVRQLQAFTNTYTPNPVQGIQVTGNQFVTSAEWTPQDVPYVITENFSIDVNAASNANVATLTVDAGTSIEMQDNVGIEVLINGQIISNGTVNNRVLFTSYNEISSWDSFDIAGDYYASEFHNTDFRLFDGVHCGIYIAGGHVVLDNVGFGPAATTCGYLVCFTGTCNNSGDPNGCDNSLASSGSWKGGDPNVLCPAVD